MAIGSMTLERVWVLPTPPPPSQAALWFPNGVPTGSRCFVLSGLLSKRFCMESATKATASICSSVHFASCVSFQATAAGPCMARGCGTSSGCASPTPIFRHPCSRRASPPPNFGYPCLRKLGLDRAPPPMFGCPCLRKMDFTGPKNVE